MGRLLVKMGTLHNSTMGSSDSQPEPSRPDTKLSEDLFDADLERVAKKQEADASKARLEESVAPIYYPERPRGIGENFAMSRAEDEERTPSDWVAEHAKVSRTQARKAMN